MLTFVICAILCQSIYFCFSRSSQIVRSHPAADLEFYVNGNRVKDDSLGDLQIFRESDGLLESSHRSTNTRNILRLTLNIYRRMTLRVRESQAVSGVLVIKCNANIGQFYKV